MAPNILDKDKLKVIGRKYNYYSNNNNKLNEVEKTSLLQKDQHFIPQRQRKREHPISAPISGDILFTQVPKAGALDQQVPHSQGDQAVVAIGLNLSVHDKAVSQAGVTCPKMDQCRHEH